MSFNEELGRRIWMAAKPEATESERWQMQFFLCKCREAKTLETHRHFAKLFHDLAAAVIERSLDSNVVKLGSWRGAGIS